MPTCRELAYREGVGPMSALRAVVKLVGKGFLATTRRGQMTLTDKGRQALGGGQ